MSTPSAHSKILILDFGSQYTQVIARRIRECQVYSEIVRFDLPATKSPRLSQTASSFREDRRVFMNDGAPQLDPGIFSLGIPVLGICYGMHVDGAALWRTRRI